MAHPTTKPSVWADATFRRFTIINSIECLAIGIVIASFPLLVSEKFGSGDALVISNALLIVPRIIFAPVVGRFLLKKGPKLIAGITMIGLAGIFVFQVLIDNYWLFQGTIVLRAIIGMACAASLMTLQTWVIPKGQNIEANSVYLATSRPLFHSGSLVVKGLLCYLTIAQCFYGVAGLFLIAASLTLSLSLSASTSSPSDEIGKNTTVSYLSLFNLFRKKNVLVSLFMPLFGYFFLIPVLQSFLFWSTIHTFHYPKASYLSLLNAKAVGAALGALVAPLAVRKLTRIMAMTRLYSIMRVFYLLILLGLAWVPKFYGIIVLLVLGALPQYIASTCFYTLLQKHLTKQELGMVNTLTFPICQFFGLGGSLLAFTYTHKYLSLTHFWLLTSAIALSIALSPLLFYWIKKTNK